MSFNQPIDSISVSGHKFLGSPVPCGLVMTRLRHVHALSSNIEYLNSRDATIMGSRNGHAAVYMWHALMRKGRAGIARDVAGCLERAAYLRGMLEMGACAGRECGYVAADSYQHGCVTAQWHGSVT